jgi:hypothetical protein
MSCLMQGEINFAKSSELNPRDRSLKRPVSEKVNELNSLYKSKESISAVCEPQQRARAHSTRVRHSLDAQYLFHRQIAFLACREFSKLRGAHLLLFATLRTSLK